MLEAKFIEHDFDEERGFGPPKTETKPSDSKWTPARIVSSALVAGGLLFLL